MNMKNLDVWIGAWYNTDYQWMWVHGTPVRLGAPFWGHGNE